MARNTALANVLQMLKADLGYALTPGVATAQDLELQYRIFSKQNWLASEFDWPFLQLYWSIAVTNRYTIIPVINGQNGKNTPINFERPVLVEISWNSFWQKVLYGIGSEQYNYINSDLGQVLNPIQRWQFSDEINFESWPVPASAQTIRFTGQRVLTNLYANPVSINLSGAGITAVNGDYIWNGTNQNYVQGIYKISFNGASWVLDSNVTNALYTSLNLAGQWTVGAGAGISPAPSVLLVPGSFNPNATCDLDDQMLMLFVSADVKARLGRKDAGTTLQEATRRMDKIRASYPTKYSETVLNGGRQDDARLIRNVPMVVIAPN